MEQVGVLRKQIEGEIQMTPGEGARFVQTLPIGIRGKREQMPLRGGRSYEEMRDAQDRARSAASKIAELESGRKTIEEMEDMTPREFDQHMRRTDLDIGVLKPRVEAAEPQTFREQYGLQAAQRAQPGQEATAYSRGGLGGTTGRSVGAGLAGAYGGLQALLALNRASASGQDAISALGGAGLQGMTSYGTVAPTAQDIGGGVGSRVAVRGGQALDERRAARDERSARRGASQFLGQFDPNLNFNQRPAEPTVQTYQGQTPFNFQPPTGFQQRQLAGELGARDHANQRLLMQGLPPLNPMMTPLPNAPAPSAPPVAVAQRVSPTTPTTPEPAVPPGSLNDPNASWNKAQEKQEEAAKKEQERVEERQKNALDELTRQAQGMQGG
tara:strand:+ start:16 stop:1167 length:1152 start_codon:yes stop_codon:yes gene_type:complete